jgi:hypothetical protein
MNFRSVVTALKHFGRTYSFKIHNKLLIHICVFICTSMYINLFFMTKEEDKNSKIYFDLDTLSLITGLAYF